MFKKPFVIDPRMFIAGPFGPCPKCGQGEYGTLSIYNNCHTRRCRICWHTDTTPLPPVRKQLVYVDQMVLSNMAKELDPEWAARTTRRDPFWLELYDQLERLVKLQVLTCPRSPIHEQESSYDDRVEGVLRRLCGHLAADVTLDLPEQVRAHQLRVAQEAYLAKQQPDWKPALQPENVINGRLDEWSDRLSISVNMGHLETAETRRTRRDELGTALAGIWSRFQKEKLDYDTAYVRELRGIADAAVESYQRDLQQQAAYYLGKPTDPMALIPKPLSRLLRGIARRFEHATMSADDPMKQAIEFLYSTHGLNTPQNRLSAMLYAALARRATMGQKRAPNRGTPNDIDVVSSYLPYCDAVFVDDEFAALLGEEPLATEVKRYGTPVFSNRSRLDFLAHLREIEANLPPDHVQGVVQTYGESWLDGFRSILDIERERDARRSHHTEDADGSKGRPDAGSLEA